MVSGWRRPSASGSGEVEGRERRGGQDGDAAGSVGEVARVAGHERARAAVDGQLREAVVGVSADPEPARSLDDLGSGGDAVEKRDPKSNGEVPVKLDRGTNRLLNSRKVASETNAARSGSPAP